MSDQLYGVGGRQSVSPAEREIGLECLQLSNVRGLHGRQLDSVPSLHSQFQRIPKTIVKLELSGLGCLQFS